MSLPYDIHRCAGSGNDEEGWREGCETCLRRTSPGSPHVQWYIEPPKIIVFECESLIEPDDEKGGAA